LSYVGIGISHIAVPDKKLVTITAVYHNSPAEEAGLQVHDNILEVDGEPVITEEGFLNTRLRGLEGSSVTLLVQTPGEAARTLTLIRRKVESETPLVYHVYQSPAGQRIGYILLINFVDETSVRNFRLALQAMSQDAPLNGLIIDNRMNYGGSLQVMLDIMSFFMEGRIGALVNRNGERADIAVDRLRDIHNSSTFPLVVFVGPDSASAGEIFPGVLRDQGRAYIIGETSPGNVEALLPFSFDDGSRIWLAVEVFEPANNPKANWEAIGIVPDQTVITHWEEFTLESDPAVAAALKYFDGLK
jgi:carboxyl-terminal processing protease